MIPSHVTQNDITVTIPSNLTTEVSNSTMWNEYDNRCINCGRCNFVCPTCTCFTMQDLYYSENGKVGERRRVWASCMVDSEKLTQIIQSNNIQSVTIVRMEVPCCGGLELAAKKALQASGKFIPWQVITISVDGKILD